MASMFTTRPEITGTFGVVASTHWIASSVGMAMLERGGNAYDAAVAAGFTLQAVEPHLCGPAGEVSILFRIGETGQARVLCGQGVAPAAATIGAFEALGLAEIPGSGLVAAVVPAAFDAWLTLLRDYGTMTLADVIGPAIGYFERGHPLLDGAARAIADVAPVFRSEWTSSCPTWLPGNRPPAPGRLFTNPALAATYRRIIDEAGSSGTREAQIDRARSAWSQGFVSEAIDRFAGAEPQMDASGDRHRGLLCGADMASWQATYEDPVSATVCGHTIYKTGPWGQGPVLLQALQILEAAGALASDADDDRMVHLTLEAIKLAFADRDAYYGDPAFVDVPLTMLLDPNYASARAELIGDSASLEIRPGVVDGFRDQVRRVLDQTRRTSQPAAGLGIGEPTMMHLQPTTKPGDTVHLDVIDRHGNMVSATPSGGWPQSSPTVPQLGFALNTRAQMFCLQPGLPASLAPGKRPRTTLTPTLALDRDGFGLVCGTPGGDQQDQWQLILLQRRLGRALPLQQAIDQPLFHSLHLTSSFYPHEAIPGMAVVEESCGPTVIEGLRRRGHEVRVAPAWSAGRLTAAERRRGGLLAAAATPRLMQAYAVGR
jgi:gamma-glutamyltranspeptidase/glutathione hydrolase